MTLLQIKRVKLQPVVVIHSNPLRRLATDVVVPCQPADDHNDSCGCQRRFHALHSRVDLAVSLLVVANMMVMAMYYDGMSDSFRDVLEVLNTGFLIVYVVEMLLKLVALGFHGYWSRSGNAIDGSIVVGSIVLLLLAALFPSMSAAKQVCASLRPCVPTPPFPCLSVAFMWYVHTVTGCTLV